MRNIPAPIPLSTLGFTLALAAALSACGGGGSDDGSAAGPPAAAALTIGGTASTGAAIAGKTVNAKCRSGSGNGTTNASGAYSITVTDGQLPCVIRVTTDSGAILHSVAQGTGSSATANITPVSQLVVARLTGLDPAAYYGAFDAAAAAAVTADATHTAETAVVQQLKNSGVDFSGVGDVLTAPLTPATATSAGNAYGQQLVTLDDKLASSGTTLAKLTSAVTASSAAASSPSATVSLPADVLLRPKASNCAALRSGAYRKVSAQNGPNITGILTIDAAALTASDTPGEAPTQLTPNGPCRYRFDDGTAEAVVSPAGLIVSRSLEDGRRRLLLTFPEQTIAVAELAGTWNFLGFEINDAGTAFIADAGTATIGGDGVLSALSICPDVKTCVPLNDTVNLRVDAVGGFDLVNTTQNYTDRYFAYRAGGGELMLAGISGDGSFTVWTKKRTNTLPVVGSGGTSWNLALDNQNLANPAIGETTNTTDTVNAADGTYTRIQTTVGTTDTHSESLAINNPRDGYLFRPAATAPAANGTVAVVREFTALGLRGMGASVLTLPALGWYMFSLAQP